MAVQAARGSVLLDVLKTGQGADPGLLRLKVERMAASAFAFFRGSCARFAADWADLGPPDPGPEVVVCGDLHLENFGAYRDDQGEFLYDVNDFDEAAVAPCGVDPVRCATSILLAAELWKLTPLQANGMVLAYLDEYRSVVNAPMEARGADALAPRLAVGPVGEILGKAVLATQSELLDRLTRKRKHGGRRLKVDPARHPEVEPARRERVAAAVEAYGAARGAAEAFRVLDVTGRVAGVGSLGVERFLVLVAGGGSGETNRVYDLKQERPSAWVGRGGRLGPLPAGDAARVVAAQRALQAAPALGLDVLTVDGQGYRFREMVPDENRSSLDRFREKPRRLRAAVVTAGRLTALAHLRGARIDGEPDRTEPLKAWSRGPALDSVLAAAARFAERTRLAFKEFRADLRDPEGLPEGFRP